MILHREHFLGIMPWPSHYHPPTGSSVASMTTGLHKVVKSRSAITADCMRNDLIMP